MREQKRSSIQFIAWYKYCIVMVLVIILTQTLTAQPIKSMQSIEKDLVPQRVAFTYAQNSSYARQLVMLIEFLKIGIFQHTQAVLSYDKPDVIVTLNAEKTAMQVTLSIMATRTDTNVVIITKRKSFSDLNLSTVKAFLIELCQEMNNLLQPLPQKEQVVLTETIIEKTETVTVGRGARITFTGMPDTVIELAGTKKRIILDDTGTYVYEQEQNTSLTFRASKPAYVPIVKTLFIGKDDITITLEMQKLPETEVEFTLRYANLVPGIHIRRFILPGILFTDIGLESSMLAILPLTDPASYWYELSAGVGLLIEDPLAPFSSTINLNIAGRLETIEGTIRIPPYIPFSINCNILAYAKIFSTTRVFIGIAMRLGYHANTVSLPDELQQSAQNPLSDWDIIAEPLLGLRMGL